MAEEKKPQQAYEPEKKPTTQMKTGILVGIGVLVGAGIIAAAYFLLQDKDTNPETVNTNQATNTTVVTEETGDEYNISQWTTARISKLGFSVKMPPYYEYDWSEDSQVSFHSSRIPGYEPGTINIKKIDENLETVLQQVAERHTGIAGSEVSNEEVSISGHAGRRLEYENSRGEGVVYYILGAGTSTYQLMSLDSETLPIFEIMAQTFQTVETEDDTAVNANSNANANANSNTNSNTNGAGIDSSIGLVSFETDVDQASYDEWITTAYQRGDHGFEIDTPSEIVPTSQSMGLNERENLLSGHTYSEGKSKGLYVTFFYKNDLDYASWVSEHEAELTSSNSGLQRSVLSTGKGQVSVYFTEEPRYSSEDPYGEFWAYIDHTDRIYELNYTVRGYEPDVYHDVFSRMVNSFTFIDPKDIILIEGPEQDVAISAEDGYALNVSWLSELEEMNIQDPMLFDDANGIWIRSYYKAGTVTNGSYAGDSIVLILESPMGPAFSPNLYRVVYDSAARTFTYLEKHSDNLSYFNTPFTYDTGSEILSLYQADEISIPDSDISLAAEPFDTNKLFSQVTDAEVALTDTLEGTVFFSPSLSCYFVETPDHLVKQYHLSLDFVRDMQQREYMYDSSQFKPDILWNDTTGVTEDYTYNERTGCGSRGCHSVFSDEELGGIEALRQTGTTSTGYPVYEFADTNTDMLTDAYEMYYVPTEEEKPTYEEFVAEHPLFFWKDPFDRWIRFLKVKYLPAAECGKPVIYLYPQTATDVNVQVEPNGGFTVTEPEYPEGGWNVTAHPDGRLEYSEGGQYPYLFWEGIGIDYAMPSEGFVVEQADVELFFREKLELLGMNEQEREDFMEFWVPKFNDAPYYFITFMDQAVFDTLALLTVTPAPDTVIRVFMDYQPLEAPVSVQPLEIRTPERNGFTVVEWGGALHD